MSEEWHHLEEALEEGEIIEDHSQSNTQSWEQAANELVTTGTSFGWPSWDYIFEKQCKALPRGQAVPRTKIWYDNQLTFFIRCFRDPSDHDQRTIEEAVSRREFLIHYHREVRMGGLKTPNATAAAHLGFYREKFDAKEAVEIIKRIDQDNAALGEPKRTSSDPKCTAGSRKKSRARGWD